MGTHKFPEKIHTQGCNSDTAPLFTHTTTHLPAVTSHSEVLKLKANGIAADQHYLSGRRRPAHFLFSCLDLLLRSSNKQSSLMVSAHQETSSPLLTGDRGMPHFHVVIVYGLVPMETALRTKCNSMFVFRCRPQCTDSKHNAVNERWFHLNCFRAFTSPIPKKLGYCVGCK